MAHGSSHVEFDTDGNWIRAQQPQHSEIQPSPHSLAGLLVSLLEGSWPKMVVVVFVAELALLFLDASLPLPVRLVRSISSQNNQIGQAANSLDLFGQISYIFSNNFNIASYELIPVYGWFIFNGSMFATARSIVVIGIVQGTSGPNVVFSLLLQPHTWLELPAYAIALTQSFYLIASIFRRNFVHEMIRTLFVWLIVAGDLLVAAIFESSEITAAPLIGDLTWALAWIAFAVLAILLIFGRNRFLRRYHEQYPHIQSVGSRPAPSSYPLTDDRPHLYDTITVLPNPSAPQQPQSETVKSYCPTCGARILSPHALYCDQCGRKIS